MKNEKPGQFPYTRGLHKNMYQDKLWTMRQYAGYTSAKESNKRFHSLLSQGVMGLSVAFDLPTQIGYDYDNVMIELYDDDEHNAIKMTSNSFDLIEQQVCYTGELLFWCGDPRTHEDALDHLNYSLNSYWGGYKIKKTDTRNKYDMLTWGMLKVGSFDFVPEPEYNTVKNYVIR